MTPPSYPQVQAPIVNNPAFWERLGADNYGTDTLFFAFYYQQVLWHYFYQSVTLSLCLRIGIGIKTHVPFAEYISTIPGRKGAEEAILEIPQKV